MAKKTDKNPAPNADTMMPDSAPMDMGAGEPMPPMPTGAEMPESGGKVMMQIPKETFMGLHQIVVQLATALDELALGIAGQDAAEAAVSQAEAAPAEAAPMSPPDEAFLAEMAMQGSQRGMA
jgi:hypothetical protein